MHHTFSMTSIAALVLALGSTFAVAQSPGATGTGAPNASKSSATITKGSATTAKATGRSDSATWERTHRVSKIIGMEVVNRHGEKVGHVEDIVLDNNGNIAYAVVSTGGFIGIGDRLHAVPWNSLRTSPGNDTFLLDVDRDHLRSAPGFDQSSWPDVNDPKWTTENRRYFPTSRSNSSTSSDNPSTKTNPTGSK